MMEELARAVIRFLALWTLAGVASLPITLAFCKMAARGDELMAWPGTLPGEEQG
jgi:hypothetical protein